MTELWRETKNNKIEKYHNNLAEMWEKSNFDTRIKLTEFTKFVPKNSLIQFLTRYELYKVIKDIPGDIFELGVCGGGGLFSFAQSVFINESDYQWRNIVGFDTFEGFTDDLNDKDNLNECVHLKKEKAFKIDSYKELNELIKVHEDFRYLNNRNQIKLVKGDIKKTLPEYLEKNNGTIISLLYCDLDLYEPTKFSLELLWNRIPKGGIIVFDEGIMNDWPGEAIALNEVLGIGNHRLVKIPNIKQFYLIKE
jgi:hypothetical protein